MSATPFRHCSNCGSERMAAHSWREIICELCGYQHFLTPIPAACVLLLDRQDRLLITRRGHEPGLGKWGLPGGVIEPQESGEAAAARELNEETGIKLSAADFSYLVSLNNDYLFQDFLWPTLDLFFVARLVEDVETRADPAEVAEVRWCRLDDVPLEEFAFASNAQAVRVLCKHIRIGGRQRVM